MRHKVRLVVKASATVSTFVRLLSCVNQHVTINMVLLGESLLTDGADENLLIWRPPIFMDSLGMANQSTKRLESRFTGVAQVLTSV